MKKNVLYLDADTTDRLLNANRRILEFYQDLVNEPSIGLFYVNKHIQRSTPKIVNIKKQLKQDTRIIEDLLYDMDSTLNVIRGLHELNSFNNIQNMLLNASNIIHATLQ
jgi:hypothetical protein